MPRPADAARTAARAGHVINARAGSYRSLKFGDTYADMVRAFGTPRGARLVPFGAPKAWTGPTVIQLNDPNQNPQEEKAYAYRGFTVLFLGPRVASFVVSDHNSRTAAGIRIGNRLSTVRSRYRIFCGTVNKHAEFSKFPACTGKVARHRWIWFGGDPIANITIGIRPFANVG